MSGGTGTAIATTLLSIWTTAKAMVATSIAQELAFTGDHRVLRGVGPSLLLSVRESRTGPSFEFAVYWRIRKNPHRYREPAADRWSGSR